MSEWLAGIPLGWGKVIAIIAFAAIAIWAWMRPRNFIYEEAPDQSRWRDLRIWTSVLMVIHIIIYASF